MKSQAIGVLLAAGIAEAFVGGPSLGLAPSRINKAVSRSPAPRAGFALRTLKAQETDVEKMSLAQKEKLYLDSCAAYNADKKQIISDDEFEELKENLSFEGSKVILMSRDEIKFMVASARFKEGKPILSDEEYNSLRSKLKAINSPALVHDAPSCKISDDGKQICKSDLTPDDGKNALLYTPALVLTALLVNEYCFWANHWDPLLSLIVGSPVIAGVTYILTNYIYFQKPFITKTQCPKCTTPQNIYFGDVLFCEGGKPSDVVKTACVNKACGCAMIATKSNMLVTSE